MGRPKVPDEGSRQPKKKNLGGAIFGCTDGTIQECLEKQLFGLPSKHITSVQNITAPLPLFLFDYSDRRMHGIYEAASDGQMNIDPHAWTNGGTKKTTCPAQKAITQAPGRSAKAKSSLLIEASSCIPICNNENSVDRVTDSSVDRKGKRVVDTLLTESSVSAEEVEKGIASSVQVNVEVVFCRGKCWDIVVPDVKIGKRTLL